MASALRASDVAALRGGAEVHVWLVKIGNAGAAEILSSQERLDATRFRISADRQRYVVTRTTLRVLLGCYTGIEPHALAITGGAGQKPALADRAVEFNVSHSGAWAALAFSGGPPVGIDIEEVRPLPEYRDLIRHFCSPNERAHITTLPEFFRLWTRKEALLKGIGKGLSQPLEEYDVLDASPLDNWTLTDLAAPEGYYAAVAVFGAAEIRVFRM